MPPVTCCGKERTSRHCPDCGARLRGSPLLDLLAHCKKTQAQLQAHADRLAEWREKDETISEVHVNRVKKRAARWQAWVEALEAALMREEA